MIVLERILLNSRSHVVTYVVYLVRCRRTYILNKSYKYLRSHNTKNKNIYSIMLLDKIKKFFKINK